MAMRTRRLETPELGPVLQKLYGGLGEHLSFRRSLEVVGDALRCHISAIHFEDYEARQSRVEVVGKVGGVELASLESDYASQWQGQNLWLKRGIEQILRNGYGDGDAVVSESELRAMPYYQHFLRPVDVRHGLGICLWHQGPERLAVATFNRAPTEGPFSKATMGFVAELHPHLVNAFAIHKHASRLEESNQSLRAAMDRVPIGMMMLDADGCVLFTNDEAEQLMAAHEGIARGCNGRLLFDSAVSRHQFQERLGRLTSMTFEAPSTSLLVRRSVAGAPPVQILHLCALPPRMGGVPGARLVAFLCPVARSDFGPLEIRMIQMVLDLTPAEAHVVVELRRTCNLEAVATALDVAPSTVRTHLKHVFEKTGIHKQAELLASVARIVALAPRASP
jgi:DNA-binding CsgD family transcriptional regulator